MATEGGKDSFLAVARQRKWPNYTGYILWV